MTYDELLEALINVLKRIDANTRDKPLIIDSLIDDIKDYRNEFIITHGFKIEDYE